MNDKQPIVQENSLQNEDKVCRTARITFRVSPEEIEVIEAKRELVHEKTIGSYVRRMSVFGRINFIDGKEIKNVNQSLSGIRGSLNQIAKRMNSTDRIYQEDLNEIAHMMELIEQIQTDVSELKSMVATW